MELLVATRSEGKMREIRRILAEVPGLRVVGLEEAGIAYEDAEEGLEPHDTFEENARSKARYFRDRAGMATVADDSGLEVDALGGAPGVRSKRFAPARGLEGQELDDANNRHLLERLAGVREAERTARYVCVAVLDEEGAEPLTFRGEASGRVVATPRGSGGFGYDPFIFDSEVGATFAEMTASQKDARSHRGAAFRQLAQRLRSVPMTARDPSVEPADIGPSADESKLRITWKDGVVSEFVPRYLRLLCPCAGCVDEMTGVRTLVSEMVDEAVYPTAIHYVGRYALQPVWSDGHSTGIYTFEYLRELWDTESEPESS